MSADPPGVPGSTGAPAPMRVTSLAPAFDLLAACGGAPAGGFPFLFEREGLGVAAGSGPLEDLWRFGLAGALGDPSKHVIERLRSLGGPRDRPAVAVGAFPFGHGDGFLAIPTQMVVRSRPGVTRFLAVAGTDAREPFRPIRRAGGTPGDPFAVPWRSDGEDYAASVEAALARIRTGALAKVVLARAMRIDAGHSLDPIRLAQRLRAVDPHAYTFVTPVGLTPEGSADEAPGTIGSSGPGRVLVGASPELLISRRGAAIRSTPLAGSAPRSGDADEDRANGEALFASDKDRREHAIVVEAIADVLAPRCDQLTWDPEPVLQETANVWHLATRFAGVLRDPAPNVVELVAELHPTPAVCGTPTTLARETIAELERFDRGGYAGPVGWMDADGDGEWAIALRCAELDGDRATLFAGAGIVAGSEPWAEVDETDRKFRAFLDSLRWG